ncbi:hypothetical protein J6590_002082 [Homalodisca vitripennis]|nr:hypothetical protein J6590_002082 [Homalodisca vitripennis]
MLAARGSASLSGSDNPISCVSEGKEAVRADQMCDVPQGRVDYDECAHPPLCISIPRGAAGHPSRHLVSDRCASKCHSVKCDSRQGSGQVTIGRGVERRFGLNDSIKATSGLTGDCVRCDCRGLHRN